MDTDQSPTFGSLLKRHRRAAGLSQEQLAERAGLTAQAISTLERGFRRAPYRDTVRALAQALALDPATAAALDAAIARGHAATTGAPDPTRPALPVPPSPLVGRAREAAEVEALLHRASTEGAVRLLTLLGPGGVGKTRLALHVAHTVADRYADGAVFVALAPLRDPDLVVAAIAQAVRVTEDAGHALPDAVRLRLREKRLLLLLDNFEHVAAAAPLVADLLAACPGLRVLVTSRARLHLSGEHIYLVPPLRTPDPDRLPPLADLAEMPAVALLVQRARAAGSDVALDATTAPALATLCRRLDGLPLAIELAAPRLAVLSPEMLARRLTPRLGLLTGGARDLPARQQTLRATLEWSYALLSPGEQALFRRLSVFAGGCALDAAEAVGALVSGDVADRLGALIDKSLVYRETAADDEPRFGMLETVREYGLHTLAGGAEEEQARRAHAEHYLALAEEAEPALTGPDQGPWLTRLDREHANLRAALFWTAAQADPSRGLRLAAALCRFWEVRGHLSEGRRWLERLLAPGDAAGVPRPVQPVRARALTGGGRLAHRQGDYATATAWHVRSEALWRALDEPAGLAIALHNHAIVLQDQGRYNDASARYQESLRLKRAAGDHLGIAASLHNLGLIARDQGDYPRAAALLRDSLDLEQRLGNLGGIANSLYELGTVARYQGDYARARALLEESLAIERTQGNRLNMATALHVLGDVARDQGHADRALDLYTQSLSLLQAMGDKFYLVACAESVAILAVTQGRWELAARLLGAAAAVREVIGTPVPPNDRTIYERAVSVVRVALGDDHFTAAQAAGRTQTLEHVITAALDSGDEGSVRT